MVTAVATFADVRRDVAFAHTLRAAAGPQLTAPNTYVSNATAIMGVEGPVAV